MELCTAPCHGQGIAIAHERACTWRQTSRPMRPKPLIPMETLRLGALATVATVREAVAMANMLAERFRGELVEVVLGVE